VIGRYEISQSIKVICLLPYSMVFILRRLNPRYIWQEETAALPHHTSFKHRASSTVIVVFFTFRIEQLQGVKMRYP
jgi:hypothetical protein